MPRLLRPTLPAPLRNSWTIAFLLYLALGIGAGFYPLVGDLHYEFSALSALSASLLAGLATLYRQRPASPDGHPHPPIDGAALWELIWRNVLLCLVPLAVALVRSLFGAGCGMGEGVEWYLLLAPPSAVIGTVLASLAELIVRRRWLRTILYLLIWSVSLLRGAYEGYSGPHIFLYAWQVGFFPGGSWDAELPISVRLLIYRGFHLLAASLLGLIVVELGGLPHRRRAAASPAAIGEAADGTTSRTWALVAAAGLLAASSIPLVMNRSDLGLTRTDGWLREALGDSLRTRFATIYYNAPSTDSLDLWRAANLTDFYITELAGALGIPEKGIEPVTLYLYASPAEEQRMVGTSSAAFTKPWARTLNMSFANVGSTLRHELAHVMIAPFGNPLGLSTSQGLIEGSAMALENDYLWRTLHQYVRAMHEYGMAPEAEQIMGTTGFSSRRTSVSYVLAGSFSKWLIDTYGMPRYLKAFPWSDFEGAYGRSLRALSEEYRRFILASPPADANYRATMRHLFGGGSFFAQKCLRRIGTLNGEGNKALGEERYGRALERFRQSLGEGINYGARGGILRALAGMGRYRELLDSASAYDSDTASYPLLPFLIERGDAHWALGDTAGARRLYDSMLALDISRQFTLRGAQRLYFLGRKDSLTAIMRGYYTRPMRVTQRLALLNEALTRASTVEERLILSLLRATLTLDQIPRTSMETLGPLLSSEEFDRDYLRVTKDFLNDTGHATFIIGSLAEQLDPAYAMMVAGTPKAREGDVPGARIAMGWLERFPSLLGLPLPDARAGRSAAYLQERRTEGFRFSRYLMEHSILPHP